MGSWALVVPVKRLHLAKSRLSDVAGARRADLALAMAADTVAAALRAPDVVAVVAVTDDDRAEEHLTGVGAIVVGDEPDAGLNPALRHGASVAHTYASAVGALSADLPALRPEVVSAVLGHAAQHRVAFLPDLAGTGTTLYTTTADADFDPRFGDDSARRHRHAGAVELHADDAAPARRDVDTRDDLLAAIGLGVGPRTSALARELGLTG